MEEVAVSVCAYKGGDPWESSTHKQLLVFMPEGRHWGKD